MDTSDDIRAQRTQIEEKDRLLRAFHGIGRAVLTAESVDEILDTLVVQIADAALFRSLSVSLVDPETGRIKVVRQTRPRPGGGFTILHPEEYESLELEPDSPDITAEVVRTGARTIIEGWDDRYQFGPPGSPLLDPETYRDKVSYFIPVRHGSRALAVLRTGSTVAQRPATESHLDAMEPLLDQVAVAIEHARAFERLADQARLLDARVAASEHENLALLTINDLVLRIRTRDDLEPVARAIFDELRKGGLDFRGMTIHRITDAQRACLESYQIRPTGDYVRRSQRDAIVIREWREQEIRYRPDIERDPQDLPPDYIGTTYRNLGLRVRSLLTVPYAHGTIIFRSTTPRAFSPDHIVFARKVASVLSVGMSRLADLERAHRARRQEETLLGISQACIRIDTPADLDEVLMRTFGLVSLCDVEFDALALHRFVDRNRGVFEVWRVDAGGVRRHETVTSPGELAALMATTTRHRSILDPGQPRSLYEVSFAAGVFALESPAPDPFSDEDTEFIQRVADVLAVGIARVADFERLAQSESRYRSVVTALAEGIVVMHADGSCVATNRRAEEILGLTADQIRGRTPYAPEWETIREDGRPFPPSEHPIVLTLATGRPNQNVVMGVRKPNGAVTWISINTQPLSEPGARKPYASVASFVDITARLEVERELKESKEFQDRILDGMDDGFFVLNAQGVHLDCNPAFCRLTGYTREELIGTGVPHIYWPEELRASFAESGLAFQTGSDNPIVTEYIRKDGARIPVEITPSAIREADGSVRYYLATARDISDRLLIERERIRSQRLRAIGELSAGISHNLNNILTGVIGPTEILKAKSHGPEIDTHLDVILKSALRAADIVRRLHRGTTGARDTPVAVDANAVIQDAVRAAQPKWKDQSEASGISIALDLHLSDIPQVSATMAGLHDVILNLIFNAVDAMPGGGRITIESGAHGQNVRITFSDTGTGMTEETRSRVFEPFFTTKLDVGTGLGLSTAYATVLGWGGTFDVRSSPGQGATFMLDLPVHLEAPDRRAASGTAASGRRARVLVVEDDEGVMSILESVLALDHEVVLCQEGKQAERLCDPDTDAAVIDLGLPAIPGNEVLARLRRINPSLGAILITGWQIGPNDERARDFDIVIQKPFRDLRALRQAVHEAVRRRDARGASWP